MDELLFHSAHVLTDDQAGGHGDRWATVSDDTGELIAHWLPVAIENGKVTELGMGSADDDVRLRESGEPNSRLLLYDTSNAQQPRSGMLCVIELDTTDDEGRRCNLMASAYPMLGEGCQITATVERIGLHPNRLEARLELSLRGSGSMLWAFDPLFVRNRCVYRRDEPLVFSVAGLAYSMQPAAKLEHVIDDPQEIRRFRARDAWAKQYGHWSKDEGEAVSLAAWKPASEEDLEPIRIDMSRATMLMPASEGPADDAAYMGEVIAVTPHALRILDGSFWRVDVLVMHPDEDRVILPIFIAERLFTSDWRPQIGEFVTGLLWLQAWPLRRTDDPPVSTVPASAG